MKQKMEPFSSIDPIHAMVCMHKFWHDHAGANQLFSNKPSPSQSCSTASYVHLWIIQECRFRKTPASDPPAGAKPVEVTWVGHFKLWRYHASFEYLHAASISKPAVC